MLLRRLAFLLLALAAAGCQSARASREPAGPSLSVLSWNLNWGMPAADEAVAGIREADADVVCLQEVTPGWEALLARALADRYPHAIYKSGPAATGLAVLAKKPLREIAFVPPPVGWFPALIVRAETALGPVQVLDVHLRPAVNDKGSFSPGVYAFKNPRTHLEEIDAILARKDPDLPAIVAGDMNEGTGGAAVGRLEEQGFRNALPQFQPGAATWRHPTSVGTFGKAIDHVLYAPPLDALSARVLKRGGSDHLPVLAVFETKK